MLISFEQIRLDPPAPISVPLDYTVKLGILFLLFFP